MKLPILGFLMIVVAAAEFISNGARSGAYAAFMMMGITWALRTRRIPWRLALIMAPLIFLSLGVLNIIRSSGLVGETATEAMQGTDAGQVLSCVQDEIDLRRSLAKRSGHLGRPRSDEWAAVGHFLQRRRIRVRPSRDLASKATRPRVPLRPEFSRRSS